MAITDDDLRFLRTALDEHRERRQTSVALPLAEIAATASVLAAVLAGFALDAARDAEAAADSADVSASMGAPFDSGTALETCRLAGAQLAAAGVPVTALFEGDTLTACQQEAVKGARLVRKPGTKPN
jgi:hypothetical protein